MPSFFCSFVRFIGSFDDGYKVEEKKYILDILLFEYLHICQYLDCVA